MHDFQHATAEAMPERTDGAAGFWRAWTGKRVAEQKAAVSGY
jgi:hypothetical protein